MDLETRMKNTKMDVVILENKVKVIVINGRPNVGKDYLINTYRHHARLDPVRDILVHNISSIDPLRYGFFNVYPELQNLKKDSREYMIFRELLSSSKRLINDIDPMLITMGIVHKIESIVDSHGSYDNVVFLHIREGDEINKLKKVLNEKGIDLTTILIEASNREHKLDDGTAPTLSDKDVVYYAYDYIYDNSGDDTTAFIGVMNTIFNK